MSIGSTLKRLLFEKELTPSDLAKAIDLPVSTITRIITGKTKNPTSQSINVIAGYLKCTPEFLLNNQDKLYTHDIKHIPCWEWNDLDQVLNGNATIKEEIIVTNVSDKAFALKMPNNSWYPLIEKDSILIFDPQSKLINRSYCLVKLHNYDEIILRQILLDIDTIFIKSINKDIEEKSIRKLGDQDKVIARLAEIRKKL